ncbi:MAG: radical SAM protein [Planctomycetes bacterium]|nr:radical SAM protein [Planctomycetota bacterium]MCB9917097.1 radical SAM protein [Planctomycetota bacterium]
MSKLSLLAFAARPNEIVHGIRRLGLRGAVVHGVRRASATTERALLGPAQIRLNPMGAICNHACHMCWLQHLEPTTLQSLVKIDKTERMSLAEYVALFDGMPRGLTEVNVVGGGEPLVHPECLDIMSEVKKRGWRGYLMSNGTLLDEKSARALVDMQWDKTRFSIHAGDRDTYRAVHDRDNFERLHDNLSRLVSYRNERSATSVGIEAHFVIQRLNLHTIPQMFAFAQEVGVDHMVFEIVFALSPRFRLTKNEHREAARLLRECASRSSVTSNAPEIALLHESEIGDAPELPFEPFDVPAEHRPDDVGIEHQEACTSTREAESACANGATARDNGRRDPEHVDAPPASQPAPQPAHDVYVPAKRCSVGFDSAFITATGDVMPCCFSDEVMGNVRASSFREIWYGAPYREFRKRLIRGQFADYCSRVRCKLRSFLHD